VKPNFSPVPSPPEAQVTHLQSLHFPPPSRAFSVRVFRCVPFSTEDKDSSARDASEPQSPRYNFALPPYRPLDSPITSLPTSPSRFYCSRCLLEPFPRFSDRDACSAEHRAWGSRLTSYRDHPSFCFFDSPSSTAGP